MIDVVPPRVAAPRFAVVPAELGDPEILGRLTHRTRIVHWSQLWLKVDGEPAGRHTVGSPTEDLELPVLEVIHPRIRVVIDDDDVRYAAWIARGDTATVPIVPIQLADRAGRAFAGMGVFLDPGAPIALGERAAARREVTLRDDVVRARGFVPTSALGEVWPPTTAPRATGEPRVLDVETPIRARADTGADSIAIAGTALEVVVLAAGAPGWTAIEIARPFSRIRGFVPTGALHLTKGSGTGGHGSGRGFGISDTDRVELATGACLFDGPSGEVIGVSLATKVRYGYAPRAEPGWWRVYVDSPWEAIIVSAHDVGTDPKQPVWEMCGSFAR